MNWNNATPDQKFYDGDRILCAVTLAAGGYDLAVVHVRCDENYFALECDGEVWGWDWTDVSHWMPAEDVEFGLPKNLPMHKEPAMSDAAKRIRGLVEKGTTSPWKLHTGPFQCTIEVGKAFIGAPYQPPHGRGQCPVQEADGELIVLLHNLAPALCDVVEKAGEAVEYLRKLTIGHPLAVHDGKVVFDLKEALARLDAKVQEVADGE